MAYNKNANKEAEQRVELEGLLIRETDKAYLIAVDNDSENEQWFPKSQLDDVVIKSDELTCTIPQWLAEKHLLV